MARLDQSIVVKTKFTYMRDGKATGGATPGNYVHQYMAREGATEVVAPMRYADIDGYMKRYMARADAVDAAISLSTDPAPDTQPAVPGATPDTTTQTYRDDPRAVVDPLGYDAGERAQLERSAPEEPQLTLRQRRKRRSEKRLKRREYKYRTGVKVTRPEDGVVRDSDVEEWCAKPQGLGGVSFSHDSLSLSHERLKELSEHVQDLFDNNHTVIMTVLSFTHDYLVDNGVVPATMGTPVPRGGYRGQVDQLKLRRAINHGLERMAVREGFDNLEWMGVIQVDTSQVHCHLALVDAGKGRTAKDGSQRGMLSPSGMMTLRRGLDAYLDEQKSVAFMASAVSRERQNVVTHVKRWTHESIGRQSDAQFLLSVLPDNKNHWRAATNRKDMRRANKLCRDLVETQLDKPSSPMVAAMATVRNYADARVAREGISQSQRDELIERGREQIIRKCMNSVYQVLKDIPEEEQEKAPDLMHACAMPMEEVVEHYATSQQQKEEKESEDVDKSTEEESLSADEFIMRLRSYHARYDHHNAKRREFEHRDAGWVAAYNAGEASPESRAMHDFYQSEIDYHARSSAKYRHFLNFPTVDETWDEDWREIDEYAWRTLQLEELLNDEAIAHAPSYEVAEEMGIRRYGHRGAGNLAGTPAEARVARRILDQRYQTMRHNYRELIDDVTDKWRAGTGRLVVTSQDDESDTLHHLHSSIPREKQCWGSNSQDIYTPGVRVSVSVAPEFEFAEVRGVDMHDMHYDWLVDQPVSTEVLSEYERLANMRHVAADMAMVWMNETGLGEEIHDELGESYVDIERMEDTAHEVATTGVLRSNLAEYQQRLRARRQQRERARRAEELERQQQAETPFDQADVESADDEVVEPRYCTTAPTKYISRQVYAAVDLSARSISDGRSMDRELGD